MKHPFSVALRSIALMGAASLAIFTTAGCSLFQSHGDSTEPTDASDAVATPDASIQTPDASAAADAGERPDVLLAQAKQAEQQGQLQEARATYARVIEIDPGSDVAKAGFRAVSATLGMAQETEDAVVTAAEETAQVRKAQRRIEAESKILQGEAAMNAGEFEKAITSFEDARTIVRWYPDLQQGDFTEESILARIDQARRKQVDQARQEEIARQTRIQREQQEREQQAQAEVEYRINTLFDAANRSYQDDRYAEAEAYLREILNLNPTNAHASRLLELATNARMQSRDRELKNTYKREWRQMFDELTADMRPQIDPFEFPNEKAWREISAQGPIKFAVGDNVASPEERAIAAKLAAVPITLSFSDTPLTEALSWFKTVTGVNFVLSPTVTGSGDAPVVTITAGPMPADEALSLVLEISTPQLKSHIKDGVVQIVPLDQALGSQILEIYDIRDLTMKITNFPAKDFNLTPSGYSDEGTTRVELPEAQENVIGGDRFAELIKQNIQRDSWTADPNNTIEVTSNGALVVRQTKDVHELIRILLRDLRQNAGTLINVESRFLTVYDTFLEDIGVDFRGLGPDSVNPNANIPSGLVLDDIGSIPDGFGTPTIPSGSGTDNDVGVFFSDGNEDIKGRVENLYDSALGNKDTIIGKNEFTNAGGLSLQATFLDDTLVEGVLRAVSKYGTANIVDAPSLTLFNGQTANLSVINHVSYVKDYDVEIAQASVIAQPIVDIIQDGVILEVRPVVSADKRFITMELRPTVALLKRPIETFSTTLGIGSPVVIEIPELNLQRARTTVHMPDGSTLMIGGWKIIEDEDYDSGIPFLNKVPILNFFVSRKGKFLEKKKLVVLVRAKIWIPEEHEPVLGMAR
jgi:type II secretory pathway component GspD/PulD (secretin)